MLSIHIGNFGLINQLANCPQVIQDELIQLLAILFLVLSILLQEIIIDLFEEIHKRNELYILGSLHAFLKRILRKLIFSIEWGYFGVGGQVFLHLLILILLKYLLERI